MFVSVYLQMLLKHVNFSKCILNIRVMQDLFIGHELWKKNTQNISQNNGIFKIDFIVLTWQMTLEICRHTIGYICTSIFSSYRFNIFPIQIIWPFPAGEGHRKLIFQFCNFNTDRPQNATPNSSFEINRIWTHTNPFVS